MSWQELEPIMHVAPRAKAAIAILKDKRPRLYLSLSMTFMTELGNPKKADVMAGTAESAGKLMLKFGPKGKFDVRALAKGGARMVLPAFPGLPTEERDSTPCEVEAKSDKEAVLILPIEAWNPRKILPPPAQPKQPTPPAKQNSGPSLDVEAYLKSKGHRVTRLSSALFTIDGNRSTISEAIALTNSHRKKAGLQPITAEEAE